MDELIFYGGSVKALGNGKVGGYLVRFGDPADTDFDGEFFTADTDFGAANEVGVYYHHGLDSKIGSRRLGKTSLKKDEVGLWAEAQLEMRDEYEKVIYQMAVDGKLGWSSGSVNHLINREAAGKAMKITVWPIGEASLTPTPAEIRNAALPIKALIDIASNLTQDAVKGNEPKTASGQGVSGDEKARLQLRAKAYLKATEK
jgi:prohead serine protease